MEFTIRDPNGNVMFSIESTQIENNDNTEQSIESLEQSVESSYGEVVKYVDAIEVMSREDVLSRSVIKGTTIGTISGLPLFGIGAIPGAIVGASVGLVVGIIRKLIELFQRLFALITSLISGANDNKVRQALIDMPKGKLKDVAVSAHKTTVEAMKGLKTLDKDLENATKSLQSKPDDEASRTQLSVIMNVSEYCKTAIRACSFEYSLITFTCKTVKSIRDVKASSINPLHAIADGVEQAVNEMSRTDNSGNDDISWKANNDELIRCITDGSSICINSYKKLKEFTDVINSKKVTTQEDAENFMKNYNVNDEVKQLKESVVELNNNIEVFKNHHYGYNLKD